MKWVDALALVGLVIVLLAALTQMSGIFAPSVNVTVVPAGIRGGDGT